MLVGMRHTKVQTDLVQKIRLWQSNALGCEIPFDVKNQPVSALLQAFVVIKGAIRVAPIVVQGERLHQSGAPFVGRKKRNPHARGRAAVHGV